MSLSVPGFLQSVHERDIEGNNFYDLSTFNSWYVSGSNNNIAQNHPIFTPALLFVSKLFSQAKFEVKNKRTDKVQKNHWMLDLLEKPNLYQTGNDFLESLMFSMIANGVAVVLKKYVIGFENEPEAMYLLNPELIVWPDNFKTKFSINKNIEDVYKNEEVTYKDVDGDIKIKIKDLLFFYDLPNMLNRNPFKVKSRLDGLKQTLINTQDSLLAKNIILKSNGKELISGSGKSGDFPMTPDEKDDAENLFNTKYGLGNKRKRGLITRANINWKSMHIALRDLGLDESAKVDGNLIYTSLHIPKDILSLEAKKTTYNNYKESMVSYIQNEMQSSVNSIVAVLQGLITEPNLKLTGSYEHLPVMQYILKERYEVVLARAKAFTELRKSGLPDDVCLQLCGFQSDIELKELSNGKEKSNKKRNKGFKKISSEEKQATPLRIESN